MSGRRWTGPCTLGLALLSAVVGTVLFAGRLGRGDVPPPSATATLGGVTAWVRGAGWVPMAVHSMDQGGGYQMPDQMMPGAPGGEQMRLGITVTLVNTSEQARRFSLAEEFFLIGGPNDTPVWLHSDTFGLLSRLGPSNGVDGVLYFDTKVPYPTDSPLVLRWSRDGEFVDLAVPLVDSGHTPHGDHGA